MKTIAKIIAARSGLDALANEPIKLEVPGYMPLSIEWIGPGPDSSEMVSVMHWYEQNGDLMRDPEMVFQVKDDIWQPWSYRQDSLAMIQDAIFQGPKGEILVRPELLMELKSFARLWDRSIREQEFGKVAP